MQTKKQYEAELQALSIETNEMKSFLEQMRKEVEQLKDERKEVNIRLIEDKEIYGNQTRQMLNKQSDEYRDFNNELSRKEKSIREREQEYKIKITDLDQKITAIEIREEMVYNIGDKNKGKAKELDGKIKKINTTQSELDEKKYYLKNQEKIIGMERNDTVRILEEAKKERQRVQAEVDKFDKTRVDKDIYWKSKEAELKTREDTLLSQAVELDKQDIKIKSDMRTLQSAKKHIKSMLTK